MLQNYIKIVLRNLWKNKTFSALTIGGLSLSMAVCLLFIMLIKGAHEFDNFHPEGDRVYRILTDAQRKGGGSERYATSPYTVAAGLVEGYALVESWVPLCSALNGEVKQGENMLPLQGLFATPSFFETFGFALEQGDPATALSAPYSLVLTKATAERLFGKEPPLGKTVEMPGYEATFTVTGVLGEFPGKTHLEFEALGSFSSVPALEAAGIVSNITNNWQNYYRTYNFIRLRQDVEPEVVEQALAEVAQAGYAGLQLETRDAGYRFELQPLGKITPGPFMSNNMGRGLPEFLLWFLAGLGLIVILSASFNYTNLTIARAVGRMKEVGVRKTFGANRRQVFWQFMAEAVVISLIALLLAYPMLKLAIQAFNQLQFTELTDMNLKEDLALYAWFVLFAAVVGSLAGLLPAAVLSKTTPLAVLQKLSNLKIMKGVGLRKALLGIQLAVSLVFLILVTIAWKQINLAMVMNFGFDQAQVLNVQMRGHEPEKLRPAFASVSGVERISAISHSMGTWADSKSDLRVREEEEPVEVRDYFIDEQYLDNFGLKLVAGQNFPAAPEQQQERFALVNETFLKQFQLGAPAEAIGKTIWVGDSTRLAIHGVLEDFYYKPSVYSLEPLLLRYDPGQLSVMNLKVNSQDPAATIAALERAWEKIDPARPFTYQFFDDAVRENYANFIDIAWIVGFFALLGIAIALMGLLGIAIYTVETRSKEVSIRKVLGASMKDMIWLLSKSYFALLAIAALVAVPLSFLLGRQFLQQFTFQPEMTVWLFLPGILLLFLLVALTVVSQTWRAAVKNPTEALRRE
ncbi:MAG: ABC transporter permease [Lewinellaceae bacterium]|nr:ABC transporter permease [Phaeodactylibacter sp.]MCB9036653.1 ABC transporter permease [Lewinellaceae bacterium]